VAIIIVANKTLYPVEICLLGILAHTTAMHDGTRSLQQREMLHWVTLRYGDGGSEIMGRLQAPAHEKTKIPHSKGDYKKAFLLIPLIGSTGIAMDVVISSCSVCRPGSGGWLPHNQRSVPVMLQGLASRCQASVGLG
jgi:hypothetical protein